MPVTTQSVVHGILPIVEKIGMCDVGYGIVLTISDTCISSCVGAAVTGGEI